MASSVYSTAHALTHLSAMLPLDGASVRPGGLVPIAIKVGAPTLENTLENTNDWDAMRVMFAK